MGVLELVDDDFEAGAHEKLDERFCVLSKHLTPETMNPYGFIILAHIALQSQGRILRKYLNVLECKDILEKQPDLRNELLAGAKKGYKSIRLASKESIELSDCGSDTSIIELLRSGKRQFKTVWRRY